MNEWRRVESWTAEQLRMIGGTGLCSKDLCGDGFSSGVFIHWWLWDAESLYNIYIYIHELRKIFVSRGRPSLTIMPLTVYYVQVS